MARELPKGVYQRKSGKYKTYTWEGESLEYVGTYDTVEEAVFARDNQLRGHHWLGDVDEGKYGFIYSVVDLDTEEIYIGRKAYKYYNQFTKARDIDSNWEFYTSSSKVVQARLDEGHSLRYTILANVEDNDQASVLEHELIRAMILRSLPSGKPMCMNGMVPKIFVRGLKEACRGTAYTLQEVLRELP